MLSILTTFAVLAQADCEPSDRMHFADLQRLTGGTWRGTLTYLDYTSNKTTTIKSTLAVERVASGPCSWVWYFGYTDEPDHDSGTVQSLKYDGRVFEDERVLSRKLLPNRTVQIVTESKGEDNDRPSTLHHVYRISDSEFSLQLLVKPDGTTNFFERHIYKWKR